MIYRRDIDGLRTLAVVPVILFHYGLLGMQGGYVGVDVFFVISGYLITSLLYQGIRQGSFGYWDFYERRFRRILPAFFVVALGTMAAGWFILTPGNMSHFGAELYNSTYFSTNFLYFRKDGYFDGASSLRLLLHTWSLSVEEQFYLLVPFVLSWAVRAKDRPESWRSTRIFIVLTGLSLLISIISVWKFHSAAYYLLPSRAWELLLGSLLALGHAPAVPVRPGVRQALAGLALALLLVPCFAYSSLTPFPGVAALAPCLGAALVIWLGTGPQTTASFVTHILSWRLCVAVGKLSYSLYLWHWPVLVLFRHYQLRDPDDGEAWLCIAITFALSVLSYFLIEQPVRQRRFLASRRSLFLVCGAVMLGLFIFGKMARDGGFPQRYTPEAQHYASFAYRLDPRHHECKNRTVQQVQAGDVCHYGNPRPGPADFAVWGDSHAEAMLPAFDDLARQKGIWGLQFSFGSCPPLLGVTVTSHMRGAFPCQELSAATLEQIAQRGVKTLIIIARWPMYAEPFPKLGTDARVNKILHLTDAHSVQPGWDENRAVIQRALRTTLERLRDMGVKTYITQPLPETWVEVPQALAMASLLGRDRAELMIPWPAVQERQAWISDQFQQMQQAGLATLLPVHPTLCRADRCMVEKDGIPLYRDGTHLTVDGALLLSKVVGQALGE